MSELIHQRSVFYNLQPFNLNSGSVESLSSYLIRLSNTHNIDVGSLVNKIIIPKLKKDYLSRSTEYGGNSFFEGAKTMNSFNENSFDMAKVLGELTSRNDLNQLTLLNFKGKFSNRDLLKNELSWCSECLKEWLEKDGLYYPLIWHFKLVQVCFKHKCLLRNCCENCFRINPILRRKMLLGYCSYCAQPMFENSKVVNCNFKKEELEWYDFCFLNIELILENRLENFNASGFINAIFTQYLSDDLSVFTRITTIPKSTLRGWLRGDNVPTLEGILKVCYALNISLANLGRKSLQISTNGYSETMTFKKESSARKPIDFKQTELELNRILKQEIPISMISAARLIGRNKRVLYYNFPDLCKSISKRYLNYKQTVANNRIKNIQNEIEITFFELMSENIFPSRAAIEKRINKPGLLREPRIKSFWQSLINTEVNINDE
ncbi:MULTISPECIES: TniQ family protein [Lysinibacillus]|uniref:TniQ family protein n=1 Tax=Lysinibacillus TaxID=400634 RepID=UPI00214C0D9A|nr:MULTISPECIES: TniQ family protein [Lysinibacillus]UUV23643.1 TniQ family protein [Lysinibacillus sp. FN11]UYB46514.1 TniQ family protein [Lysinibacillus capsici]